jgi:hypothetical protein
MMLSVDRDEARSENCISCSPHERSDMRDGLHRMVRYRRNFGPDRTYFFTPTLAGSRLKAGTTKSINPRSRGAMRPRFASSFTLLESRGRRESRVRAAPAVSRAICR